MKVVGRAGIGVDNVDIAAATKRGVVVMNTPHGNAVTTAEHAIAMMLALARQIPQASQSTKAGKWEKSRFMGTELTGKCLGLVGCGNIGSIVADRAQGLRMRVVGYDPYLSEENAKRMGVEKVDLDELLRRANFISIHAPMTAATRNIIGAALDVFMQEPATDNILFDFDAVVATPHLGASTVEAQEKVAVQVAEQMAEYLTTGALTNALNIASVSAEEALVLKPYMDLGSRLGEFLGQVSATGLKSVVIELDGRAAKLNADPITAATLAGLLGPNMESVNMVNAADVASSNGISVSTIRHDRQCDYETLLRVTIMYEDDERTIAGTLIGGNKPRIVEVQSIAIESDFPQNLLYLRNYDSPGFIGDLGSLCGQRGLNIATFHLGRRDVGGEAVALVEIDGTVPDGVLGEIKALSQVVRADILQFS